MTSENPFSHKSNGNTGKNYPNPLLHSCKITKGYDNLRSIYSWKRADSWKDQWGSWHFNFLYSPFFFFFFQAPYLWNWQPQNHSSYENQSLEGAEWIWDTASISIPRKVSILWLVFQLPGKALFARLVIMWPDSVPALWEKPQAKAFVKKI